MLYYLSFMSFVVEREREREIWEGPMSFYISNPIVNLEMPISIVHNC